MRSSAHEVETKGIRGRLRGLLRRVAHLEPVDPASWYVVLDGEFHGPISRATLVEVLAEHDDDLDAPLWNASHTEEWTTMLGVPGLAAEVAACRAQLPRTHAAHPSDRPPFDESIPSHPAESAASTQLDIGAALRTLSEKEAPAPPTAASVPASGAWTGPERRRRADRQRPTWLGAGIALGALAVALLVAPLLDTRPAPIAPPRRESTPAVVAPEEIAPPAPVQAVAPALPVPAAPVALVPETPPAVTAACDPPATETPTEHHHSAPAAAPVAVAAVAAPAPTQVAPPPTTSTVPAASRSIDDLLVAAAPPEPAAAPPPVVAPREAPTDAEVVRALESRRDAIVACTPVHAVAALRITIHGPTGMVNGVYVDGVFAGTPAGSCIAREVRRARVAPFAQPTFTYSYPFRL